MSLRNRLIYGSSIFLSIVFFSCEKKSNGLNDSQVFRYNEHSNISSLDPAFAKKQADIWPVHQLFNGLVQLDDSLQIKTAIAKSWEISEDGKIYKFNLRKDVYFHKHVLFGEDSTRTVVASDVEYSFNRLLDPKVASPGNWVLKNVSSFKAINDSIFKINLKEPFPPFLGLLTMKYCSIVPKEIVSYYGNNFRSNPIGTGPFKFKLWIENTKLVFRKNEHYFEKDSAGVQLPYLEAVAITFLPDKQSEFLQLVQGNIDFLSGLDASYKDDILSVKGNLNDRYKTQFNMMTGSYLNTEYLGLKIDVDSKHPIANISFRKALNYGFDREKMMLYMRNGIGTPAVNGFIPKGLPGFIGLKGYSYQPEIAKELVKQYMEETGDRDPTIAIATNSQYVDLCEYIQRELQKIGITVAIDIMPPSTLRKSKKNGELPIARSSWIADFPDAENYLFLFYSKNFAPKGPNFTHFNNKRYDELYEEAFKTVNDNSRYKIYQQMDSILIAEAPIIPLYYDAVVRFSQKNVKGLEINPINLLKLKRVSKVKQ